jgi:nicotinamide mononucleotide transporter
MYRVYRFCISVWYARAKYFSVSTGLIATVITVYLLFYSWLPGDMMINEHDNEYGWYKWTRKVKGRDNLPQDEQQRKIIGIDCFYYNFVVFSIYKIFDYQINVDNYIDIIASRIFFERCGMANKKIENWILWIIGI